MVGVRSSAATTKLFLEPLPRLLNKMPNERSFTWGAATSAYQIEGAYRADGRGLSIWDAFVRQAGNIRGGDDGNVACDHYGRLDEDLELMGRIGLQGYRFSISWPRVMPDGTGAVNGAGLDFYDRLVDGLLARDIEPLVTLFHWDYPLALAERGGWGHSASPAWFAAYAALMVERLGDRVRQWITFNEPQVFMHEGHFAGIHAPGLRLSQRELLRACHHVLLAHGTACQAMRAAAPRPLKIGWAPAGRTWLPASERTEDIEAAREKTFSVEEAGVFNDAWWTDPVVLGRYPESGLRFYGDAAPAVDASEMAIIAQPLDFLAVNLYFGAGRVRATEEGSEVVPASTDAPSTLMGWPITPDVLYWSPRWLHERYGRPLLISECGISLPDTVAADGEVHDEARISFLSAYLEQLQRAQTEGVDVRGFYHWSLLDNFEWAEGFKQRFGLIHIDYTDGTRTLKDSARWYSELIETSRHSSEVGRPLAPI